MKLAHLAAAVGAAALLAVGHPAPAYAQTPTPTSPAPVDITSGKACGTVTLTFKNPMPVAQGFRWNAVAGKVATADGARTGLVTVGANATVKETVRYAEDEFDGEAALTLAYAFGAYQSIQPQFADIYPVDTDCDSKPPVTYPAPCEIGAGVDNGESGKQADADAPCVSNSAGYERDEVGKACDLESGEPGRGDGIVTAGLKCEEPAAETTSPPAPPTTPTTPPTTTPEDPADLDCGDFPLADGRTAQQVLDADRSDPNVLDIDNDGTACESDDTGSDGLNPGPITSTNGESVFVPSGGVETGGGPA